MSARVQRKRRPVVSSDREMQSVSSVGMNNWKQKSETKGAWELRLKFNQVLVMWMFVAGTIIAAFIVGLSKGKEIGRTALLDERGKEVIKLPVLDERPSIEKIEKEYRSIAAREVTKGTLPTAAVEEPEIDFSKQAALPSASALSAGQKIGDTSEQAPKPGFASKGTDQVLNSKALVSTKDSFFVQAHTTPAEEDAKTLFSTLKTTGFDPFLEEGELRGKKIYRVVLGPYTDHAEATKAMQKLTEEKSLKLGRVFIRKGGA